MKDRQRLERCCTPPMEETISQMTYSPAPPKHTKRTIVEIHFTSVPSPLLAMKNCVSSHLRRRPVDFSLTSRHFGRRIALDGKHDDKSRGVSLLAEELPAPPFTKGCARGRKRTIRTDFGPLKICESSD